MLRARYFLLQRCFFNVSNTISVSLFRPCDRRDALCVSAILAVARVSVRPSDTLVDCIQTAKDIVKLLSRPGSPIILVFDPNSKGNTLSRGAIKIQGVEKKFAIFDGKRAPSILEMVRHMPMDGPWLL